MPLQDKCIVLAVTGSIASYKSIYLFRLLSKSGAKVKVILTQGALKFIQPMAFQALSAELVCTELWDTNAKAAMSHIELAKWADIILVAPATAHVIAKLAAGLADDLLTNVCLASKAPLFLAPAMNQVMYSHRSVQHNLLTLHERGVTTFGPARGWQACGDLDEGRMIEPEHIVAHLERCLVVEQSLAGVRVVITAGPTQEAIDPVRYLTNYSSGKMGYALAVEAVRLGASVTLISGPCHLEVPPDLDYVPVITALEMHAAVMSIQGECDIFIGAAAVADYRYKVVATQKRKKSQDDWTLNLVRNPDIVKAVCQWQPKPFVVAFAAETEDLQDRAQAKLESKGCDLIVANQVGPNLVFGQNEAAILVIDAHGVEEIHSRPKTELAYLILQKVTQKHGVYVDLTI